MRARRSYAAEPPRPGFPLSALYTPCTGGPSHEHSLRDTAVESPPNHEQWCGDYDRCGDVRDVLCGKDGRFHAN